MPVEVSIVIPAFNEEDNILPLARETVAAMEQQARSFEVVFVDDASTDQTWARIREANRLDRRVWGLRHHRNSGQSAAVWTGLGATQSAIIGTLDGDRQNDPADLPSLLDKLAEADFVSGMRVNRQDSWLRRVSSKIARWARAKALGVDFRDTGCGIRVWKRSALRGVFPFNGLHRFLPILVHGNGATTVEVPVHHRPRPAGQSKYGVWNRLGRGIWDLFAIAWYQKRRLRPTPYSALDPAEPPVADSEAAPATAAASTPPAPPQPSHP